MRLFGRDIRLFAAPPPDQKPAEGEFGKDGDSWRARIMGGGPDINPRLSGRAKFVVYDEMRKTDPSCKSLLWMEKLPIVSAHWQLHPASTDGVDELIAEMVARNLGLNGQPGHMAQSWKAATFQGLQRFDWGSMLEELIWDDVVTWRLGETDRLVRPLARLAPRYPASILNVEFDKGRVKQVKQWVHGARPIPGDKIAYGVLDPDSGRWDGVSLLRSAWGSFEMKKQLTIAAGIGWDRYAAGLPVVRYPKGGSAAEQDKAEGIGKGIRLHEEGFVALEGPKPTAEAPDGWDLELLNGAATLPDATPLLKHYAAEIAASGLQQFTVLGTTSSGNRALGEVLAEPFYLACTAFAEELARDRVRQVIRRIVDVNFGPQYDMPRLTVSKIQTRSLAVLAQVIGDLAGAGFNFSDLVSQNYMRSIMEWPALEEDLEFNRERLRSILKLAGLGDDRINEILAALPDDAGIVPNRAPREGDGL